MGLREGGPMTFASRLVSFAWVFLMLVLIASCSSGEKTEPKTDPVPVAIGDVHRIECNQTIFVSGSVVSPDAPSTLMFLVSGKVIFVGPREGDYVKRGQKLAEIDPLDYRLSVAAAAAALEQAKVGLRRA